jgi:SHC-transforming protein 1
MTEDTKTWTKGSNGFIKKPGKGWLHDDDTIQDGITYNVKYIGCIGINESMKSLSFEIRTQVARESIRRVAESAKLLTIPRKTRTKNDEQITKILNNTCVTQWTGMNVQLHVNTQYLRATQSQCNDTLFQHTMQNISFACGGDTDIQDFVAYVAKDEINGRACYVFECFDNMANNVITTIGQAFELRFRKFLSSMPQSNMSGLKSSNKQTELFSQPQAQKTHQSHHHLTDQTPTFLPKHHASKSVEQHQNLNFTPKQAQAPVIVEVSSFSTKNIEPLSDTATTTTSKEERLDRQPWFHGLLTRDLAEKLLVRDGDYLVRETNKAEKQYVLSGRYKGECRHIFLVDPSGVVRTKDRVFDNISHLIQYHQDNNIPIISKENELLLENPVCK